VQCRKRRSRRAHRGKRKRGPASAWSNAPRRLAERSARTGGLGATGVATRRSTPCGTEHTKERYAAIPISPGLHQLSDAAAGRQGSQMPWSRRAPLCRFNNPGAAPVDQRSRFQASQQDALATPHFSSPLRRPKRCARRPRETALRGRFQTPRQDVALFLDNLLVLTPLTSAPRSRSQDGGRMPKENCTYLDAPPPPGKKFCTNTHTH
jgi:hypothetical protein